MEGDVTRREKQRLSFISIGIARSLGNGGGNRFCDMSRLSVPPLDVCIRLGRLNCDAIRYTITTDQTNK